MQAVRLGDLPDFSVAVAAEGLECEKECGHGLVTKAVPNVRAVAPGVDEPRLPEGTQVIVRFGDGSTATMTVVTIPEDSTETLTRDSPLGRALVGAEPGDTITYSGPDGTVVADVLTIRPPAG